MSYDDDTPAIGGDGPGSRVLPGSPQARRRHFLEDDGLEGPGVEDRPKQRSVRRPSGLWERWISTMQPVLFDSAHDSTPYVNRAVFNKHVKDLRVDYDDREIARGFRHFAELIRAGRINLHGKAAWFVFYARRQSLLQRDTEGGFSDAVELPEGVSEVDLGEGIHEIDFS